MDPTEDLSARVLLRHILSTEPPRTPVTRSVSRAQATGGSRRSTRSSRKDAGAQTPQDILRRSLKHKIRESITRKSLPPTTRRTGSAGLRRTNTPAPVSVTFDEGDTPRHILMNILRTEPVKSPVVHEKVAADEPQPPSANTSISSKRSSIELSELDPPDLSIGNVASTAKGLSRKRLRRSLNVTAFEKRLKDRDDVENEDESVDHSSLSSSSSMSLSLKTPFVDVRTEKKGLQRRVSNRRKITEEEFGAAVNRRQMEGASSIATVEQQLSDTNFTLGLSKLSDLEITNDIINCKTALYDQADAVASSFSMVATQDKPTVMASQLQREMEQVERLEEEQSHLEREKSAYVYPTEEPHPEECVSQPEEAAAFQEEEQKNAADCADGVVMSKSEVEEAVGESQNRDPAESDEENQGKSQTEEGAAGAQSDEDAAAMSESEKEGDAEGGEGEEEEEAADSQTEEESAAGAQSEEDAAAMSESEKEVEEGEEEEEAVNSQTEEESAAGAQSEEDAAAMFQSGEEEEADVEAGDPQSEVEDNVAHSQTGDDGQEEEDGKKPLNQLEHEMEHKSGRAHRSEGRAILAAVEAGEDYPDALEEGWVDGEDKTQSASGYHSNLKTGTRDNSPPETAIPDSAEFSNQRLSQNDASCTEPDADKENFLHPGGITRSISRESDGSPAEAAAADAAEQEEESEDEEEAEDIEEIPMKTPAFVREKRNYFQVDPLDSPTAVKSRPTGTSDPVEGLPPAKPKQVRKRKSGAAKREPGLPKKYLMDVFKHFAKTKVSTDVYPVLREIMDKFFERMADDLETYAVHARRKTIEVEDVELLLKRQGHVNDKVPVEVLIEKYLRMEQRKLLIPIATSGNVVVPKMRR